MVDEERTEQQAEESEPAGRRRRVRPAAKRSGPTFGERLLKGRPARIMRPRLVFLGCLFALLCFGLVMVYSASSVEALKEEGSSTYYLVRQAVFILIGLAAFAAISSRVIPWQLFRGQAAWALWMVVLAFLLLVLLIGTSSGGAKRWIDIGFSFQPSEFAKPVLILVVSNILAAYYEDLTMDTGSFLIYLVLAVGLPAFLIIAEPDFGTTVIILATVAAMVYMAGISYRLVFTVLAVVIPLAIIVVFSSSYRTERIFTFLDPWSDPYGDGYQATLAIMAFASGGLFGRGIGNSTMKYNYLPEAHNDYILAIIGEELGFVGTVAFLAVYIAMIAAAFLIASRAPTLHMRLLASGCAFILAVQASINILGILSVIPMTGKPLPFISYGGSSMVSSLMLAGIILRVSRESERHTAHDAARASLRVVDAMTEQDIVSSHLDRSTAGEPTLRSASRGARPSSFTAYDGGRVDLGEAGAGGRGTPRRAAASADGRSRSVGWERHDLNNDPYDRLRGTGRGSDGEGDGPARDSSSRRNRYDQ